MADEQVKYGYESDEVVASPFNFGLNKAFLTKFEWIPNGGKDGAEQEALEIVFNINGKDKNYRQFPVTQAFGKNNEIITDRSAPEFKEAVKNFNAIITHIAHAFLDNDTYKAGLSKPTDGSFKAFVNLVKSLLPRTTPTTPLDLFMQYQWQPSKNQTRTYLEIPSKMKSGAWLKPAVPGEWKENILDNPKDNDKALWYTNEKGEEHPIWKNGWFMKSNYAKKQSLDSSNTSSNVASNITSSSNIAESAPQNAANDNKEVAVW